MRLHISQRYSPVRWIRLSETFHMEGRQKHSCRGSTLLSLNFLPHNAPISSTWCQDNIRKNLNLYRLTHNIVLRTAKISLSVVSGIIGASYHLEHSIHGIFRDKGLIKTFKDIVLRKRQDRRW